MQHRGEIVRKAIYESGYSITKLAQRVGKSRRWMYQMFENRNVSLDVVMSIGAIIHHDFSGEIKELRNSKSLLNEPQAEYKKIDSEVDYWKTKYLNLLEEYNQLLKKK